MDIENMSTHEIAKYLREERHTAFILWTIEDVLMKAQEIQYSCTTEQAKDILPDMWNGHDCEHGLTWYILNEYIVKHCEPLNIEA